MLILAIASLLILTACSGQENTDSSANSTAESTEKNSSEEGKGKALEDGVLDLATNAAFPPYEFYEGEKMVGIDIEIAEAISQYLGYELKMHDMEFANIIASIENGKVDGGIAGMSVSPDRQENADFSAAYAKSVQLIILTKDSPIQSIDDLEGKKIGAQMGTTGAIYAADDFGEENVQSFNTHADAIMAMQSKNVDAVICDEQTAKSFLETNDELKVMDTAYSEEEYAIALSKGNKELLDEVNEALKVLTEDGTIQKIIDKYIKAE